MSSRGFGPGRSNRNAPAPAGGILTASNGLTKVGTDVRLGGALSANTIITMGVNPLGIVGDVFGVYDSGSRRKLVVDTPGTFYGLGDMDFGLFGTALTIDDAQKEFRMWSGGNPMVWANQTLGLYYFGAFNSASNFCNIEIHDASSYMTFRVGKVNPSSFGQEYQRFRFGNSTGFDFLDINYQTRIYSIGDFNGLNNGCYLNVNDNNNRINIDNTAHNMIVRINGVNGFSGTVAIPTSITVVGGIVTNVT